MVRGAERERWLGRFLARVIMDGAAGALAWTYLPSEGRRRRYGIYAGGRRVRQTRDVRRVLAAYARRVRGRAPTNRNRALGPERGSDPIFAPAIVRRASAEVQRHWTDREPDARVLPIDPRSFVHARFEEVGSVEPDPALAHFYGSGPGTVSYRFIWERPTSELTLRLHASSEVPGAGMSAGPEDTSNVIVRIDGEPVARIVLPVDDGVGEIIEQRIDLRDRPSALTEPGEHRLTFEALDDGAAGMCLYVHDEHGTRTGVELLVTE